VLVAATVNSAAPILAEQDSALPNMSVGVVQFHEPQTRTPSKGHPSSSLVTTCCTSVLYMPAQEATYAAKGEG
jgi:hypothetical protein